MPIFDNISSAYATTSVAAHINILYYFIMQTYKNVDFNVGLATHKTF